MEDFDDPILPSALTDTELSRYVSSLLDDPSRPVISKRVVAELLSRYERLLYAAFDKKREV
jgi:hypothetical protein